MSAVVCSLEMWYKTYMKVILLKDVRRIGSAHEIKDVSEGYAYNYLLPQKLAEIATPEKIAAQEALKAEHDAKIKEEETQLDTKIDSLRGKEIRIQAKATEKGGLFKSIAQKDIARAIREQHSLEIPESAIDAADHFKTTGAHTVQLQSKNKTSDMTLQIEPSL